MTLSSPRKIALIGGSGFIGTRLTSDLLKAGHDVVIGDIAPSRSYPDMRRDADVREFDQMINLCAGCDTIINLAAAHRDDIRPISLYYDTNVTGARVVCEAAEKTGINTIIFTSSVAVYGHQHGEPDETAPHKPIGPYGETKSQAEDVYRAWQAKKPQERNLVIVRPTVVFGPTNRGNVHVLMDQIAKGHFIMIGDGTNRKSMAFVGNVSAFLNHTLSLPQGYHVYNYIDKPDFSMRDLVALILTRTNRKPLPRFYLPRWVGMVAGACLDIAARILGRTLPISRVRIEKFCATTAFNADKMRASGFTPPTALGDALALTIDAEFSGAGPTDNQ
jgi:nucleoside-diphosphate-sugar epimerase